MDKVARLAKQDRAELFTAVARRRGMTEAVIEKDFWVCWILHQIHQPNVAPSDLLFKGGTSLSKVFQVIDRFSEDIDLSFDRADLGFSGDCDPMNANSGKKRQQRLENLVSACTARIKDRFTPMLAGQIAAALGEPCGSNWKLEIDEADP